MDAPIAGSGMSCLFAAAAAEAAGIVVGSLAAGAT
jgi:hypothetical protein